MGARELRTAAEIELLSRDERQRIVDDALSAEEHRAFVERLDDPDLATT